MKRWLFISGIILIIILIAIWVYLLLAPEDTKQNIFNAFGLSGTEEGSGQVEQEFILPEIESTPDRLRQLTTRRVAGYTETALSTTSLPLVFIVEAGTGHIYSIDPVSGIEERISNVTIRNTTGAAVSPSGDVAAIISQTGRSKTLTLVDLSTFETTSLPDPILEAAFTATGDTLLYTTPTNSTVTAKSLAVATGVSSVLFEIPFREVDVLWGREAEDRHYFYPKTTRQLEGYLYSVEDAIITREPIEGFGLAATAGNEFILFNRSISGEYGAFIYNTRTDIIESISAAVYVDKCGFLPFGLFICADNAQFNDIAFPDNWYRGEISYADPLSVIDPYAQSVQFLDSTIDISGREIDTSDFKSSIGGERMYFINKNDNTLWVYDILTE